MLLLILAVAVFSGLLFVGIRYRVVWARGGEFRRDEQPVLYWIVLGLTAAILAIVLFALFMVITGRGHL